MSDVKNALLRDDIERSSLLSDTTNSSQGLSSKKTPNKTVTVAALREVLSSSPSNWVEDVFEILFHIKGRNTTIRNEILFGFVQFISCLYVLPVVPKQLEAAGYSAESTVVVTACCCSIGSVIAGLFANLPFIIAPPTSISIFFSIYLQQQHLGVAEGSFAVILSGVGLIFLGWRPLGSFVTRFIPSSIQVGTAVGIGLITALAGATEINLVVSGQYTIVELGEITPEVLISLTGLVIVAVSLHYHIKGAFCIALVFGTIVWWSYDSSWPVTYTNFSPETAGFQGFTEDIKRNLRATLILVFDLLFLYALTLNGLVSSFSDLSGLTRPDGTTPRNRWLFVWCGVTTVISGLLSGPPILISPESGAGIKAGARTGLSTIVCGCLFSIALIFSPLLEKVPNAGTAPLLMMIGVVLFQNVKKIDWTKIKDAVPAFCVLFFIPFTYSILQGVAIGYCMCIAIGILTGDFYKGFLVLRDDYFGEQTPERERMFSAFSENENGVRVQRPVMSILDQNVSLVLGMDEAGYDGSSNDHDYQDENS